MRKPIIAIPLGDPAGIGPEIVLKSLADSQIRQIANCIVVGNSAVLERMLALLNLPLRIRVIGSVQEALDEPDVVNVVHLNNIDIEQLQMGKISGMCGRAAYEYIAKSIELANEKLVDAVCTPPINKEALHAAGVNFIGHTEIFGALTGTPDPLTLFEVRNLRVFFLSRHLPLSQVCSQVTKERVVDYVKRCTAVLHKLGIQEGTMAIAGLNPHCGEHGLFGDEEVLEIEPAIRQLREEGYQVAGPIGADSVFHLALQGKFNSVLSLYHDQGHIATKTLDFERTISITGGMPILRTSVDHGTAFDLAGKGIASPVSMKEAILIAAKYAPAFGRE